MRDRPRPATVTQRISAPVGRVWDVIAAPGALARYHPFCSANPVSQWPGVGARDSIHYRSGLVLHRRFTAWHEGQGFSLEIGKPRWPRSYVRWDLVSATANASDVTISIWPTAFAGYPSVLRWTLRRVCLIPLLRRYLRAVLRGLDYHVTTGRHVTPNQFGRVWLFSHGPGRTAAGPAAESPEHE